MCVVVYVINSCFFSPLFFSLLHLYSVQSSFLFMSALCITSPLCMIVDHGYKQYLCSLKDWQKKIIHREKGKILYHSMFWQVNTHKCRLQSKISVWASSEPIILLVIYLFIWPHSIMACIIGVCMIHSNGISHILYWFTLWTRAILCLFKYFGNPKGPQGPGCQGHPEICPLKTH